MHYRSKFFRPFFVVFFLFLHSVSFAAETSVSGNADAESKAVITYVKENDIHTYHIAFPNIPDWEGHIWWWGFESQWEYQSHKKRDDGSMVLTYRFRENTISIVMTPEVGAVSVVATAVPDPGAKPITAQRGYNDFNPDVSVKSAPMFALDGQFQDYYKLVKRKFMFTRDDPSGWVFLSDTERNLASRPDMSDGRNLPRPWVQTYIPDWLDELGYKTDACNHGYAACSKSHKASVPLLGIESIDGKYLFANAGDYSVTELQNMWRSCLHVDPQWDPTEPDLAKRTIRTKMYVMDNDKEALLKRWRQDFYPDGDPLEKADAQ